MILSTKKKKKKQDSGRLEWHPNMTYDEKKALEKQRSADYNEEIAARYRAGRIDAGSLRVPPPPPRHESGRTRPETRLHWQSETGSDACTTTAKDRLQPQRDTSVLGKAVWDTKAQFYCNDCMSRTQ